jgi:hypothetical protein
MIIRKKILALFAPAALLALSACATGFPADVQRFQAMPAPQGESFFIQAANPENRGGLEFSQYAELVRRHMLAQGYSEAAAPEEATMLVSLDYGVDQGRDRIAYYPGGGWGSGFGYPYYSRFGYYGRYRHPFYWGWYDPFFDDPFHDRARVYTVYTSYLDMDIRRASDGQALFEGLAQARSRTAELPVLVPNLVEAMFTGFPGNSGETVRITVAPERERR